MCKKLLYIFILITAFAPIAQAFELDQEIAREIKRRYNTTRLRILVMDFTYTPGKEKLKAMAKLIRRIFVLDKNFATLEIENINSLISKGTFRNKKAAGPAEIAAYLGKKIRAHKIVIGNIFEKDGDVIVDVDVVDIDDGEVEFSKRFIKKQERMKEKSYLIAEDIVYEMFGLRKKEKWTYLMRPEFSLASGLLMPRGEVGNRLSPGILTTAHAEINAPLPFLSGIRVDFSAGFSRLASKNIEGGDATLLYAPMLVTVKKQFTLSRNPLIPDPAIFAGGGATYLALKKEQYSTNVSSSAVTPTAVAGMALSFSIFRGTSLQLEGMYHYINESAEAVTYMYAGVRFGMMF